MSSVLGWYGNLYVLSDLKRAKCLENTFKIPTPSHSNTEHATFCIMNINLVNEAILALFIGFNLQLVTKPVKFVDDIKSISESSKSINHDQVETNLRGEVSNNGVLFNIILLSVIWGQSWVLKIIININLIVMKWKLQKCDGSQ